VALGKADIAAVLLAFTGEIAFLHNVPDLILRCYCSGFSSQRQLF
jgi:hypothetical protein